MRDTQSRRKQKHPGWYTLPGGKIVDVPAWTPPQVDLPDNPLTAMRGLLEFATLVWDEITLVWGGSRRLMEAGHISGNEHRRLGDWVRNLELLVRRVILIMALALKLAPVTPDPRPPEKQWRPGRYRRALIHDPTSWHVSFALLPKQTRSRRRRNRLRKPLAHTRPAWRLALRIEALRRVLSYPRGWAIRLARTLQRIKARNATANQPRRLELEDWDFDPYRRTLGKHAVAEGMELALPLSQRSWDEYCEPG